MAGSPRGASGFRRVEAPLGWSCGETQDQRRAAGSAGIAMPLYRLDAAAEAFCRPLVLREAAALTRALGGDPAPLA